MIRFEAGRWVESTLNKKPDAPPAPDYEGAAQATAQGNLDATRASSKANRINQYTPYGNLEYSHTPVWDQAGYDKAMADYQKRSTEYNQGMNDGGPPPIMPDKNSFYDQDSGWSATQTLSPAQQQILDRNNNLSTGLLGTAEQGLGQVNALLSNPTMDESRLAQMPIQGQSVQDAIMSRLQPQMERQRGRLDNQLANQGIMRDSEAWKNAQTDQGQQENDLMTQAALQGINTGMSARQQGIQEQAFMQDRPLNIINALRSGNQVQSPQFTNVPQQQTTTGADILGASKLRGAGEQNAFNQEMGAYNNMMGGLFDIGAAFAGKK